MRSLPLAGVGGAKHRARTALAWCVFAAMVGVPAAAAAPPAPPRTYPIAEDTPARVFYVQRSMNANTVVYDARLHPDGSLDRETPMEAYWLRFNTTGERRALNFIERAFAFGPVMRQSAWNPPAWTVHLSGYAERSAVLTLDQRTGRPVLFGQIAGQTAILRWAYVQLEDDSASLPRVKWVTVFGVSAADGRPLQERIVP